MTDNERIAAIATEINAAEFYAAAVGMSLAKGEALFTEEFAAKFDDDKVKQTFRHLRHSQANSVKEKARLAELHVSLNETAATATFPRPRSGK